MAQFSSDSELLDRRQLLGRTAGVVFAALAGSQFGKDAKAAQIDPSQDGWHKPQTTNGLVPWDGKTQLPGQKCVRAFEGTMLCNLAEIFDPSDPNKKPIPQGKSYILVPVLPHTDNQYAEKTRLTVDGNPAKIVVGPDGVEMFCAPVERNSVVKWDIAGKVALRSQTIDEMFNQNSPAPKGARELYLKPTSFSNHADPEFLRVIESYGLVFKPGDSPKDYLIRPTGFLCDSIKYDRSVGNNIEALTSIIQRGSSSCNGAMALLSGLINGASTMNPSEYGFFCIQQPSYQYDMTKRSGLPHGVNRIGYNRGVIPVEASMIVSYHGDRSRGLAYVGTDCRDYRNFTTFALMPRVGVQAEIPEVGSTTLNNAQGINIYQSNGRGGIVFRGGRGANFLFSKMDTIA